MSVIETSFQQRSPEWFAARIGVVTASEFHRILTPKTMKKSDQAEGYRWKLVGEWLTGKAEEGYKNHWTDRGTGYEAEALARFKLQTGLSVQRVGFVYLDDKKLVGCSPDGLMDNAGLEIKAPAIGTHARYLLRGGTKDYWSQIQGGLWIAEKEFWYFESYHPDTEPAIVRVNRDDVFIKALATEVSCFVEEMLILRNELIERGYEPRPPVVEELEDDKAVA